MGANGEGMLWCCDVCNRKYKDKTKMRHHIETHLDSFVSCPLCNQLCKTRRTLKTHIGRSHGKDAIAATVNKVELTKIVKLETCFEPKITLSWIVRTVYMTAHLVIQNFNLLSLQCQNCFFQDFSHFIHPLNGKKIKTFFCIYRSPWRQHWTLDWKSSHCWWYGLLPVYWMPQSDEKKRSYEESCENSFCRTGGELLYLRETV